MRLRGTPRKARHSNGCQRAGGAPLCCAACPLRLDPTADDRPRPALASPPWWSWALLLLGVGGFAALWVMLGLNTDRQHSWMAVLGALDVALMLRLGGWPRGSAAAGGRRARHRRDRGARQLGHRRRAAGYDLGITPWDSALRLGSHHAWTLLQLANGVGDALWIAAGAGGRRVRLALTHPVRGAAWPRGSAGHSSRQPGTAPSPSRISATGIAA